MKCPWGCGWSGSPEEYIKHLETCSAHPRLKGKVLDGYIEAARVKTLEKFGEKGNPGFKQFTFLFDEGMPTEEKIKMGAENEFEASIRARDEFTKRRGTYHTTSRFVG